MTMGLYLVTGRRGYRGHPPGTTFQARLNRAAEQRALTRGDIRLLHRLEAAVPRDHQFPDGWLADQPQSTTKGASRRPSH